MAAGLKALGSWQVETFGELLKQSCGGHGYLQISGLTKPHLDFGVGIVTAEGDNHVLLQQTAMILLKKAQTGEINLDHFEFNTANDLSIDQQLLLLHEIRYKGELKAASAKIQQLVGTKGLDFKTEVWNDHCQISMVNASKYYIQYILVRNFFNFMSGTALVANTDKTLKSRSQGTQNLMRLLFVVYASYWFTEELQTFYENIQSEQHLNYFFNNGHLEIVIGAFKSSIAQLAYNSRDIVTAFDFEDAELLSALGKKDLKTSDDMYAEILRVVRLNPLNKKPVPTGFNKHMKPLLLGKL